MHFIGSALPRGGSDHSRFRYSTLALITLVCAVFAPSGIASPILTPDLGTFIIGNDSADGSVAVSQDGSSFTLTGGNDGSGLAGSTTFTTLSSMTGLISFAYDYESGDSPQYDNAGYVLDGQFFFLADTAPATGASQFSVSAGDVYGFYVATADNTGDPGILTVTFASLATPEPSTWCLLMLGFVVLCGRGALKHVGSLPARAVTGSKRWRTLPGFLAWSGALLYLPASMFGDTQNHYVPSNVTSQLILVHTSNLSSPQPPFVSGYALRTRLVPDAGGPVAQPEVSRIPVEFPHPAVNVPGRSTTSVRGATLHSDAVPFASLGGSDLTVSAGGGGFGFQGLSHYDQRNANSGNQFSVEPPNTSIAVANGFVLEGVNNAVRVFDSATGNPLTGTVSSNELFGLTPAIDRTTGIEGVFPTDMRVFYDREINRWFVVQRSQDNDIFGDPIDRSHIYIAVSLTSDPTGNYNIYEMDTTNASNAGCPCVSDFPQIGADQYGLYISANEYGTSSQEFVDASILAISKNALASGALTPSAYRFLIPLATGYEFTIQPASVPVGASQFLASGGLEYFVSTQSVSSVDNHVAIWALSNTASLQSATASLALAQSLVTTLTYNYPGVVSQRPGPLPYGSSLSASALPAFIDGGIDSRILSLTYAGGRLFATLATQLVDSLGHGEVGAAYVILSPTFRNATVAATVVRQGFISVTGNSVLRPAIAVNAQGRGAIAFTLVGPDYYPSSAYVSLDTVSTSPVIQIASAGTGPEDGFTGYNNLPFAGIARWGDYSSATVGSDGSIWLASELIPSGPRTTLANWGTFISRYVP